MNIPLSILVLEDEAEVAQTICAQLTEGLTEFSFPVDDEMAELLADLPNVVFTPQVSSTDNLSEAREIYHRGRLDLFIADYKVKELFNSTKASAVALPLLKEIKNAGALTPIIGHTAIQDLFTSAVEEEIVDVPIHKKDYDSTDQVVTKGIELCTELVTYKRAILNVFYTLKCAAACASPIDKQTLLRRARESLIGAPLPRCYPWDYKRSIVTLRSILLRLSSIKSDALKLSMINFDVVEAIEPLFRALTQPRFTFREHAIPVLERLEAMGYQVITRVDI